jgi:peptide/nickel transport system permease protein
MTPAAPTIALAATPYPRHWLSSLRRAPGVWLAILIIATLIALALLAPWLAPYDPNLQQLAVRLQPPSATHLFGTDSFGRDILSRIIYGCRPTLLLVSLVLLLTVPTGLLVGISAAMAGGWVETVLMRATDIVLSLPKLVLALALIAVLGPGLFKGALALALTAWPVYARQARAETLTLRHSDYLSAARMHGIQGWRLWFGHVLPMCLPTTVVRATLDLGGIILAAAGLGFLGLGVQPPTAEWGSMVADGSKAIFDQWWIATAPGGAIVLASLAFNLLGDGLRNWLDPKHD